MLTTSKSIEARIEAARHRASSAASSDSKQARIEAAVEADRLLKYRASSRGELEAAGYRLISPSRLAAIGRASSAVANRFPGIEASEIESRTIRQVGEGLVRAPLWSIEDDRGRDRFLALVESIEAAATSAELEAREFSALDYVEAIESGRIYGRAKFTALRVAAKIPTGRGTMPRLVEGHRVEASPNYAQWVGLEVDSRGLAVPVPVPSGTGRVEYQGIGRGIRPVPAVEDRRGLTVEVIEAARREGTVEASRDALAYLAAVRDTYRSSRGRSNVAWHAAADTLAQVGIPMTSKTVAAAARRAIERADRVEADRVELGRAVLVELKHRGEAAKHRHAARVARVEARVGAVVVASRPMTRSEREADRAREASRVEARDRIEASRREAAVLVEDRGSRVESIEARGSSIEAREAARIEAIASEAASRGEAPEAIEALSARRASRGIEASRPTIYIEAWRERFGIESRVEAQ